MLAPLLHRFLWKLDFSAGMQTDIRNVQVQQQKRQQLTSRFDNSIANI